MIMRDDKICPYCAAAIPSQSNVCIHCGRDLQDSFLVVPDGARYGIALGDEIKIHGLTLEKAQELAGMLNSIKEMGNR